VTDNAAGDFTVNWDTDFSDTNYAFAQLTNDNNDNGSDFIIAEDETARAVGSSDFFSVRLRNNNPQDMQENSIAAFGAVAAGGTWDMPRLIAKAWVSYDQVGTATVEDSENVVSVTDNGAGDYTINWDTDFASASYAAVGHTSHEDEPTLNSRGMVIYEHGTGTAHLAASLNVWTTQRHNNKTGVDARSGVMAFGDQ